MNLKVVNLGENGVTEKDILIHDETTIDFTLHLKLATMPFPEFPIALGVIRSIKAPTYDEEITVQIKDVQAKNPTRSLKDYLMKGEIWEVK